MNSIVDGSLSLIKYTATGFAYGWVIGTATYAACRFCVHQFNTDEDEFGIYGSSTFCRVMAVAGAMGFFAGEAFTLAAEKLEFPYDWIRPLGGFATLAGAVAASSFATPRNYNLLKVASIAYFALKLGARFYPSSPSLA